MKLIKQSFEIIHITPEPYKKIELAARNCYGSEDKISEDNTSANKMVKSLRRRKHDAMIEFASMHVKFVMDRTVSHELVRHRLASYAQSSQRYINYVSGVTFILPPWLDDRFLGDWGSQMNETERLCKLLQFPKDIDIDPDSAEYTYLKSLYLSETSYIRLIQKGWEPEKARKVLPGSASTSVHIKANFREWMHIFNLRYHGQTGRPDPTMYEIMDPLYREVSIMFPEIF